MVGVGAGLGKHPPAGSNNGYSSIVFQPPSQGVLVIEMDFRGIKEMDFFIYCVFWLGRGGAGFWLPQGKGRRRRSLFENYFIDSDSGE